MISLCSPFHSWQLLIYSLLFWQRQVHIFRELAIRTPRSCLQVVIGSWECLPVYVCNIIFLIYITYHSLALILTCCFVMRSLDVELLLPTIRGALILATTANRQLKVLLMSMLHLFAWKWCVCQTAQFPLALSDYLPLWKNIPHFLQSFFNQLVPTWRLSLFIAQQLGFSKVPSKEFFEDIFLSLCRLFTLHLHSGWFFYPSGAVSLINL